jgi:hypothetical protein
MSTEEELKWMTKRYTWRYIPFRYQAMVATIVSALLYFNVFNIFFVQQESNCGSLVRPQLDQDDRPRGWFWNIGSQDYNDDPLVSCSNGYYDGLFWSALFSFVGIAICGLVMRRAIKREGGSEPLAEKPITITMSTCPNCGTSISTTAKICKNCRIDL